MFSTTVSVVCSRSLHVEQLAAALRLHVPAGQQRRGDFGDLEPLGHDEAELIDRPIENRPAKRWRAASRRPAVTSSISTLRATTARCCRWRWLLSVITIDVSPSRGSSSNRVTLAASSTARLTTSAPPLISTSPATVSRSFAAAGRGRRKLSTCRAAVVSSGATMSSANSCRPDAFDEQHELPGVVAADRRRCGRRAWRSAGRRRRGPAAGRAGRLRARRWPACPGFRPAAARP